MSIEQFRASTGNTGNNFFNNYTTTNAFVELAIGFPAQLLSVINDSDTDPVQISWDGTTTHHELQGAEFKDLAADGRTSVFVKATAGGEKARITAS